MKLIITRHGEAESGAVDSQRKLTAKGEQDMARMGKLVRATGWNFVETLSSPLVRARQTAKIIAEQLGGLPVNEGKDLSPGFDPHTTAGALDRYDATQAAVWVFHAPDVARLASYLTGLPESGFYFPPGGMVALKLPLPAVQGRSLMIWKMQPEFIENLF